MSKFQPSPQQKAIYEWIDNEDGSCVVEAVAGSGKTTTLIEGLGRMKGQVIMLAYNKAIAAEIKERVGSSLPNVTVSTVHAAGFKYLRRAYPQVQLNDHKCRDIYREKWDIGSEIEGAVLKLVSLAKQAGLGALRPQNVDSFNDLIDHFDLDVYATRTGVDMRAVILERANIVLDASNEVIQDEIDFEDMVYGPVLKGINCFGHDWVLLDEAQDTNATRRALALMLLKRGGRLVAVGDRHQAIYGFTGADSDALDLIAEAVNAKHLPLTVSYRCPQSVVQYAQRWVRHIQAHESAPAGSVNDISLDAMFDNVRPGDAVLCRFNAPLVDLVYTFIREGRPAKIEGRDFGNGLKSLARRMRGGNDYDAFLDNLDVYVKRQVSRLRAKEQEAKAAALEDQSSSLEQIVLRCRAADPEPQRNISELVIQEIDSIFADVNHNGEVILLSSIHRSKGREWNRVFWLQTGPSKWARKQWEMQQENNLCYVAATRAKSELHLVEMPRR